MKTSIDSFNENMRSYQSLMVWRIFLKAEKKDRVLACRFLSSDYDEKFVIVINEYKVEDARDGKWSLWKWLVRLSAVQS